MVSRSHQQRRGREPAATLQGVQLPRPEQPDQQARLLAVPEVSTAPSPPSPSPQPPARGRPESAAERPAGVPPGRLASASYCKPGFFSLILSPWDTEASLCSAPASPAEEGPLPRIYIESPGIAFTSARAEDWVRLLTYLLSQTSPQPVDKNQIVPLLQERKLRHREGDMAGLNCRVKTRGRLMF